MKKSLLLLLSSSLLSFPVFAAEDTTHQHNHVNVRPDDHAPLGVMGDHMHKKGEWMTSYRYSSMQMKGNLDGTNSVSSADILSNYMVAPKKMSMEMHMFGVMYGVSDDLTITAMLPYIRKSMDAINRMGVDFSTKTAGFGDVKLNGSYRLYDDEMHHMHATLGVSLPTGKIDKRDTTPMGNMELPYGMQLGSGTYDLLAGITLTGKVENWSWGGQISSVMRTGENDNDYRLGNTYNATLWGARKLNENFSTSLRLEGKSWGNISGSNPALNPMMTPAARSDLRAGKRVDLAIGINLYLPEMKGHRFAIEASTPVYQHLDGPQMEADNRIMAGWQLAF